MRLQLGFLGLCSAIEVLKFVSGMFAYVTNEVINLTATFITDCRFALRNPVEGWEPADVESRWNVVTTN